MNKVIVIGLDGATWDLLMPLAKEGFLPNLAGLLKSGTYGELESTIPPVTAPAWASFATGKNPGKTGIYDFLFPKNSLDNLAAITSKDIAGKTFYETLEENNKRTILINLPVSFPPRTGNPTITSILTQGNQFIFPAALTEKIPELQKYRIVPDYNLKIQGKNDEFLQDIRELEETRFKCAQKLFEWEWDLFFLLFSGTDWIQHELYDALISGKLNKDHVAFQVFRDIDSYIGWFLENLPRGTSLLLMSDHGFNTYKGIFHMNAWLKENGFLESHYSKRRTTVHSHRLSEGVAKAQSNKKSKKRLGGKIPPILPGFCIEGLQRIGLRRVCAFLHYHIPGLQIDIATNYSRSSASCTSFTTSGIYLNMTSRFQNGVIESQDARHVREEIISKLQSLKDPLDGQDAFQKVMSKEELYWGDRVKFAPDILILPRNYWVVPGNLAAENKMDLFTKRKMNFHSMEGIFLAYGAGSQKGHEICGAKIYDIAPTILHLLGTPIPKDMDGKVLKEIFERNSELADRPIQYERTDERTKIRDKIEDLKRLKEI